MNGSWLSSECTLGALTKTLYGLLATAGVIAAWLAFNLVSANSSAAEANLTCGTLRQKLTELKGVSEQAAALPIPTTPAGMAAIGAFQSALQRSAEAHGCDLTEFTSSQSPSPYLSRYSKNSVETTWSQVEIKFQINGTAKSILQSLTDLAKLDIPFEMVSVEFTRQATVKRQEALLSGNVELNVLIQPTEPTK